MCAQVSVFVCVHRCACTGVRAQVCVHRCVCKVCVHRCVCTGVRATCLCVRADVFAHVCLCPCDLGMWTRDYDSVKYELKCLHVYVCGECTHVCLLKYPHGCAYISVTGGMGPCMCVCVCAHTHTRLLLPIPRLWPSPLTMPEHPSCITHEPVSKQSSRSKGNSINKPSAGSLALIGCPCLPPC